MALERIIAHKRREVAAREAARPLATVERGLAPSERSLEAALRRPRAGYVMECKKASPSRGRIRDDFDPAAIAREYAPLADAVSVLTDAAFFEGSLDDLAVARAQVTQPVIMKDFVLGPYQLYEGRAAGADAALLMLSVLDDATLVRCRDAARELGLDVLAEVHDEAELERAVALGFTVIGINNRNLATLEVDLAVTERLAPLVPGDRVVVAESGVGGHGDALRLRPHADAFLVGSSLMSRPDLGAAVRELVFGRVKVCGLTRSEDAVAAHDAGAIYGGLIFADDSPRRVTVEAAREIARGAPLEWVGVFVDEVPEKVVGVAAELGLAAVQLHGTEDRKYFESLRRGLPEATEIWKAVRVRDRVPPLAETGADRIVCDTYKKGVPGGTGERFDWSLLDGRDLSRVIVGGGLDPECAAEADTLGAFALDVNSGVEERPGVKSADGLWRFFAALRGVGRSARGR
jgi:indole-3-glycerol phosphate synthase/phosphoribosylanthranilate isomerase